MKFVDRLGPLRLQLPLGWVELPGSSSLARLFFVPWTDDAWVGVEVYQHRRSLDPPTVDVNGVDWLERAKAVLEAPAEASVRQAPSGRVLGRGVRSGHQVIRWGQVRR